MNLLDEICYSVGQIVVFGGGGLILIVSVLGLSLLLWNKILQYIYYKYKHLLPWAHLTQDFIDECIERVNKSESWEYIHNYEFVQVGRLVTIISKDGDSPLRKQYALVKKHNETHDNESDPIKKGA